ncbi:MAG: hypothetical protein WAW11_03915 [Patescibacteria group bacterium]
MTLDELRELKTPHLFRDVLMLMSGLIFIIFLNLYFKYDLAKLPNYNFIINNNFLSFLLILSLAYFAGRCIRLISDLWMNIIGTIFSLFSKLNRKKYKNRLKEIIRYNFGDFPEETIETPQVLDNEDICLYLSKNKALEDEYARRIYFSIILHLFLGEAIVFCFLMFNWYFFVLIIILSILLFIDSYDQYEMNKRLLSKHIDNRK